MANAGAARRTAIANGLDETILDWPAVIDLTADERPGLDHCLLAQVFPLTPADRSLPHRMLGWENDDLLLENFG